MTDGAASARDRSNTVIVVLTICAGLVGSLYVFLHMNWHIYFIPAGSMEPTLRVGDNILARNGPFEPEEIRPGEVILFAYDGTTYVRRVVGVSGDRIQVTGGALHINGEAVPAKAIGEFELSGSGRLVGMAQLIEERLDGRTYETLDIIADASGDDTDLFVVPEAHVFVMGDNRDYSHDSRFEIGFVPVEQIVGIARTIYWSPRRGDHVGPIPVR